MGLADVAGTGTSITIAGKKYHLGRIGLGGLADMEDEVIRRRIDPAENVMALLDKRRAAKLPVTAAEDLLIAAAVKESGRMGEAGDMADIAAFCQTLSGAIFLFYLSAKERHPDEVGSPEQAKEIFRGAELTQMNEIVNKLVKASGLKALTDAAKNSEPPVLPAQKKDPHESRGLESIAS